MSYMDVTGKTEDEAIRKALAQLGMDRDDVSVEILERAKSGFLGLGGNPARVRVTYAAAEEEAVSVTEVPAPVAEPVKKQTVEKKQEVKTESDTVTDAWLDALGGVVKRVPIMDENGVAYNINADTAAAQIAAALGAEKLIILTDVMGLMRDVHDDSTLISRCRTDEVPGLIEEGVITGMKNARQHQNRDGRITALSEKLLKTEDRNIDQMKPFL